jgi:hypothetical protein
LGWWATPTAQSFPVSPLKRPYFSKIGKELGVEGIFRRFSQLDDLPGDLPGDFRCGGGRRFERQGVSQKTDQPVFVSVCTDHRCC